MVGTVIGRKHILEGIAAWKEVFKNDSRARLIIKARFQYNNYGPDDPRIRFIDTNETTRGIAHWYARADVLLALGNEGFGLPLVEAMATGLPVIALDSEGQSDVCADARGCLLPVSPARWEVCDDPPFGPAGMRAVPAIPEIAAHLRWVAAHPKQARAMGRAASKWVLAHRNVNRMGPAVLDVLEKHVHPPRPLRQKDTLCVPSWRSACGIAEYCAHLAAHLDKVTVTAALPDMRAVRVLHIQHEHCLWNNAELLQAAYAAKGCNVPVVITEHAVDHLAQPWEGQADVLIAHTPEGIRRLQERWPHQRIVHLPHGCPQWFPPRKQLRGRTIGVFGFLERHKGLWQLLDVLTAVPQTELLMFSHARDPSLAAQWNRDAQGLAVRRCGDFLPAEEVARRLAAEADILVFWYDETQTAAASGAVRVGLASGVPVLTSPVGWFQDVREATYQPDNLRQGVERLLQDTTLGDNLVEAAKTFCHRHSWPQTAARHQRLWRQLR
jgi:glycosyltransferase involved in cell wall biosynthesis